MLRRLRLGVAFFRWSASFQDEVCEIEGYGWWQGLCLRIRCLPTNVGLAWWGATTWASMRSGAQRTVAVASYG